MGLAQGSLATDTRVRLRLLLASALTGLLAGVVVSGYRWLLEHIEVWVAAMYGFVGANLAWLPALVLALAALGFALGALGRRFPMTSGSGIPQVVAVIKGYLKDFWLTTLVAKFIGGAAAMLGGLALGREGPCIQMGACVGGGVGRQLAANRQERRLLVAGGASAGLSAAFGAPLAGVIFVFEEVFHLLSPLTMLTTAVAAIAADYTLRLLLGAEPVFQLNASGSLPLNSYWVLVVLGIALGLIGAAYNICLVRLQRGYGHLWKGERSSFTVVLADSAGGRIAGWFKYRLPHLLAGVKAAKPVPILLLAIPVGLCFPVALSSGKTAFDALAPTATAGFLALLLLVRFAFSVVSFAAGAPGGILFPLLILGAITGALAGLFALNVLGVDPGLFDGFIIVAMAGAFAAIVRAPITGIVLLLEMTGNFTHLLPLTLVSITAYLTAEFLRVPPVYASLLKSLLED
ncbi:MAG: ClC family H(+)/Cl(-) exchange transporter [Propionibacteriaceae bacterium]|jgi:H+/Cl- antiporter ClcA|nr:ClC family H(+)/Cl(-) exchange transporter [Propionibacteriaceae bacterium]